MTQLIILIELLLSPRFPEHMGTCMNVGTVLFDTEDEGIPMTLYIPKKN